MGGVVKTLRRSNLLSRSVFSTAGSFGKIGSKSGPGGDGLGGGPAWRGKSGWNGPVAPRKVLILLGTCWEHRASQMAILGASLRLCIYNTSELRKACFRQVRVARLCFCKEHCFIPQQHLGNSQKMYGTLIEKVFIFKVFSAWPCLKILDVKESWKVCLKLCLTLQVQNCAKVPVKQF